MTTKRQGRRSAQDAEQTRQHILRVATALFCEFGYARVSLRTISEKAGISHSLIRHHFGSKEQIWYGISDNVHQYIDKYCQTILAHLSKDMPVNEMLYQFTVRVLAFTLLHKQPIQLMADVVRQEGGRFDYFIDKSGKVEKLILHLTEDYNQRFPENAIKIWEIKWQMIMFAHSAASLRPFLNETWSQECTTEDECLLKHWQMCNEMMAAKFQIPESSRLQPQRLEDLVLRLGGQEIITGINQNSGQSSALEKTDN
ncbi:TetR/AcrR family transcriptional regulator [Vibrio mangrovi]|uniref:HTH-type transcriptional regulator AcrR n=1 Tax=Vibrio mangrovi TaxID=474394 RepID=A0A1Y6ITD0_9VIBR|nr:TetR/AcrR family transcriptional regulator [Vibrio mangrovi]MDW6004597.1 TetR/AcrR family transcriptional regulator [Vibrio mangrovi]SMS00886.1 HTH-type transcriptional regulator AcrR [Vibrio mangrovi]